MRWQIILTSTNYPFSAFHTSTFTMKRILLSNVLIVLFIASSFAQTQTVEDNFEGNGTISTWAPDDCLLTTSFANPLVQGINTSPTVLRYKDVGGQYANVRFDVPYNFDLSTNSVFTLKIYVPSNGLTGSQPNQISLKLQDGTLTSPWVTQSEIVKPISLDQWQTVSFDFANDPYYSFDPNSAPPIQRPDFNRVLLQVNGENNTDQVTAYVDDVQYNGVIAADPSFDQLVWFDECDGNGQIDTSKWFHQTQLPNGDSWFNGEVQHYTDRQVNSYLSNGTMNIVGKRETYTSQGKQKQFTSARLNSKFAFQYGKVEVRAKLPTGVGTWPAIWMLGKNVNENGGYWDNKGFGTTGWPACGEVDIMEHWGTNQNYISSALHTPSSFGNTSNVGGQTVATASTDFHIFTLEWYPQKMVFKVDGIAHYTYKPGTYNAETWPFNAAQYILLNFAILPSTPASFTQDELEIDYVRVYQASPTTTTLTTPSPSFDLKIAPNPAHQYTTISYTLAKQATVKLFVQDMAGKSQQVLVDEDQTAGTHQVHWDLQHLKPGVYFYSLVVENGVASGRCVVVGE